MDSTLESKRALLSSGGLNTELTEFQGIFLNPPLKDISFVDKFVKLWKKHEHPNGDLPNDHALVSFVREQIPTLPDFMQLCQERPLVAKRWLKQYKSPLYIPNSSNWCLVGHCVPSKEAAQDVHNVGGVLGTPGRHTLWSSEGIIEQIRLSRLLKNYKRAIFIFLTPTPIVSGYSLNIPIQSWKPEITTDDMPDRYYQIADESFYFLRRNKLGLLEDTYILPLEWCIAELCI